MENGMRMRHGLIVMSLTLMLTLSSAFAGLAQPRPGPGSRPHEPRAPMPMLMGARDPELTRLVHDILILRAINSLDMTREQMEKLIPKLEQVVAAEKDLRTEARSRLQAERQRLLTGAATAEESRDAQAAINAAQRQYAQQVQQILAQTTTFLSAEQIEKLKKMVMGAFLLERMRPGAAERAPAARGMAPSGEVIEHIVNLLKEKVQAMSAATGQP